ncbi:MAG: signal peptide peptidase SppA [bacterium]
MRKLSEIILIALLFLAGVIFVSAIYNSFTGKNDSSFSLPAYGDSIGLVEIEGVILNSEQAVKLISDYLKNGDIKALLVRINSPGGGVAASQEIYQSLKNARARGLKVVASMSSVAASGGYYIACAADTIVANPGTTTGSIGVIMSLLDYSELLSKIGVKYNNIKSGKFKDTGDGSRAMTPEERKYLQAFLDDAYAQFVDVVVDERNLKRVEVLRIADGRIYTGQQALDLGLVDILGSFDDAKQLAATMADITGDPHLVRPQKRRPSLFDLLFNDLGGYVQSLQNRPILRYQLIL